MSIRTSEGRKNKVSFRFTIDEKLRQMAACASLCIVHDEGVYLCAWPLKGGSSVVARPTNGNQGMDAGFGDDFKEEIGAIPIPPGATELHIELTDEKMAILFSFPVKLATPIDRLDVPRHPIAGKLKAKDRVILYKNPENPAPNDIGLQIVVQVKVVKGEIVQGYVVSSKDEVMKRGELVSFNKAVIHRHFTAAEIKRMQEMQARQAKAAT